MAKKEESAKPIAIVQMVRDAKEYPAPHSADVHPDEVENYKVGGWTVKE
jgi:hypothetical protein